MNSENCGRGKGAEIGPMRLVISFPNQASFRVRIPVMHLGLEFFIMEGRGVCA